LITLVGQHLLRCDDACLEDALIVVDIRKEQVERLDPLDTPALDHTPFAHRDGARNGIERNQTLCALLIAVQREGDASPVEQ